MSDKKPWLYGRAVENPGTPQAKLRFLSVSQLSLADPAENGCLRKWHYEKILGKKRPPSRATKRGDELHEEIEKYLKTGERSLSSLALSGLHMVPDPIKASPDGRPDMLIEWDLLLRPTDAHPDDGLDLKDPNQYKIAESNATKLLATAPLRSDGIPVLGRMDLVHWRGVNKGATDIEDTIDPPGTVEVLDWKSAGGVDYLKKPKDLPKLIQMAGYGSWVFSVLPETEQARLSHGYFIERGGPSRKVTLRVFREEIEPTWNHAGGVARSISDAAREIDPDKVDANTNACDAYGGCAHREYCRARMHVALTSFVGQTAAENLIRKRKENEMGLLDKLKKESTAPSGAYATPPVMSDVVLEKARLEADEIILRHASQLREAVDGLTPILGKLEGFLAANDLGSPPWDGMAAKAYHAIRGTDPAPGSGKLAGIGALRTVSEIENLIDDFTALVANGTLKSPVAPPVTTGLAGLAGLVSPETPDATNPAVVAVSYVTPPPVTPPPVVETSVATIVLAPPVEVSPPPEKPKKGRPKKDDTTPAVPTSSAFTLVVDGVHEGLNNAQSFQPVLDAICAELAAMTSDSDLRCAGLRAGDGGKLAVDRQSPLDFGKWEGALAALLRERDIPAGVYTLDTRGNRAAEVAADALRERCRRTGGLFFWGRR